MKTGVFLAMAAIGVLGGAAHGGEGIARRVVIVGVDGLSPRGVDEAPTPNLNRLMAMGSSTLRARGVFPTSSSSNWASMIMGAGPEQHGITSNDWDRWNAPIEPAATISDGIFPTVFGVLREQRPDAVTAAVYHWGGFGRLIEKGVCDLDVHADDEEAAMARAVSCAVEMSPTLLFVHLDHVDAAGHGEGWHTAAYSAAVTRADALIGRMMDAIEQGGGWDDTVLIVTSDHGGVARSHGGETMAELEIPWIIAGAGVAAGREITRTVNTFDTACTAAMLLGVEPHSAWIGRGVTECLATDAGGGGWRTASYVPSPRFDPPGGLVIAEEVVVTLSCEDAGAAIHYTLDGSTPTDASPAYAEPLRLAAGATVRAVAVSGGKASRVTSDAYRLLSSSSPRPVSFRYYEGSWEALPVFSTLEPAASGAVPEVGLGLIPHREDNFAVRFEARFRATAAGTHSFHLASDDGSRLIVNGRRLIDNDGSHGMIERTGEIDLKAGLHSLVVEYFEDYGGEEVTLSVTGPDRVRTAVTADMLAAPGE